MSGGKRMAGDLIARASIVACVAGVAVPLYFLGPPRMTPSEMLMGGLCFLLPGAAPFVALGWSAWAWRGSLEASLTLAFAIGCAVLGGLWAWWEASQDPKGLNLLVAAVVVPPAQLLVWGGGYGLARLAAFQSVEPAAAPDQDRM